MKIAHLLHDEKFSDSAYDLFEKVKPGASTYYVTRSLNNSKLQHIKTFKPKFISIYSRHTGSYIKELLRFDLIIVHALSTFNVEAISRLSKYENRPVIVWIGMGYDYYDLIYDASTELYLADTKLLADEIKKSSKLNLSKKTSLIAKQIIRSKILKIKSKKQVLNYIDYFSPVLPSEFQVLKSKLDLSFNYISWNYGVNKDIFENTNGPKINHNKKNILLGNSATLSNNHIEAFKLINRLELKFDKLICPLSYGDINYRNIIIDYGYEVFKKQFKPLIDFVPLEQYIKIIQHCPIVIMNHTRQQAGGNISSMLYKGATVFLNKKNPFYEFYLNQGVRIFNTCELENNPDLFNYRLTDEEVIHARHILKINFGLEASLNKTEKLIQLIDQKP